MNLIQIKQIDGLQSALNQISSSVYNLNVSIDAEFDSFNDFWGQLSWTTDSIQINSVGEVKDGDANIALRLENGGLSTSSASYFKGSTNFSGPINSSSSLNLTSSVGQLNYLSPNGVKQFTDCIAPNYSGVTSSSASLSSDNYIVGVRTASVGGPVSLTLPNAQAGKEVKIKDEDAQSSFRTITVSCLGSQTIDGHSEVYVNQDGGFLSVYSNGSNWFSLNQSGVGLV